MVIVVSVRQKQVQCDQPVVENIVQGASFPGEIVTCQEYDMRQGRARNMTCVVP